MRRDWAKTKLGGWSSTDWQDKRRGWVISLKKRVFYDYNKGVSKLTG